MPPLQLLCHISEKQRWSMKEKILVFYFHNQALPEHSKLKSLQDILFSTTTAQEL